MLTACCSKIGITAHDRNELHTLSPPHILARRRPVIGGLDGCVEDCDAAEEPLALEVELNVCDA